MKTCKNVLPKRNETINTSQKGYQNQNKIYNQIFFKKIDRTIFEILNRRGLEDYFEMRSY